MRRTKATSPRAPRASKGRSSRSASTRFYAGYYDANNLPSTPHEGMERAAVINHAESVTRVAFALQVNDRYQIRSMKDYDRRIAEYSALLASARPGERADNLRKTVSDLVRARESAKRGRYFEGAKLGRPRLDMYAVRGSSGSSDGGSRVNERANCQIGRSQSIGASRQQENAKAPNVLRSRSR